MNRLDRIAKRLIKQGCRKSPKPEKERLIRDVVEELAKEEPMTDDELNGWSSKVREMVNNFY